jgi:ParB family transcriptional regulator, chromosome partitioning protein
MSRPKPPDEWPATLLPPRQFPATPLIPGGGDVTRSDSVLEIPLESLDANPYQTRTTLDDNSLQELARSIRMLGLLEPIVVRANGGGRYQVIAGERRVKACYMAGVYKVSAVVREVTNEEAAEMTVIENLLREDVNPMDQAHAFRRLADEFGLTHEQIADRTGKSRTAVTNFLRLLQLPPRVQEMLRRGKLSMGHAKALLALSNFEHSLVLEFAQKTAPLSVRKAEELIAEFLGPAASDPTVIPGRWLRPKLCEAQHQLRKTFATRVAIIESRGKGHIRIPFADLYELERLFTTLTGQKLEIAHRSSRGE